MIDALTRARDVLGAQLHLRELENQGITPLRDSYNLVIAQLITTRKRSQAWDLFAHMRLVSHPEPGIGLFNTMIRACGTGDSPSPERAVDLFQELREHGLEPTASTYEHLVRACARTRRKGQPSFYASALDFSRQMIDAGFEPGPGCLHALLEGAKRHGDLARARWIVAHMASSGCFNSVALAHLFQTYASYKIPTPQSFKSVDSALDPALRSPATKDTTVQEAAESLTTSFPGPMPQTSAEVLRQTIQIMASVLDVHGLSAKAALQSEQQPNLLAESDPSQAAMYKSVRLDTFLINSFLLAVGPHTRFQHFCDLSEQLLKESGVLANGQTYRLRMEACEKPGNTAIGAQKADAIFSEWGVWSRKQPRTVDCCTQAVWTSMIRSLARASRVDEAFDWALELYLRHPPRDLLAHAKSEVAINYGVPAFRMSLSSESYPETKSSPTVPLPPMLTYADVHILYKRLADAEDGRLNRLKGFLRAYSTAAAEAKRILRAKPSSKGKQALLT